MHRFSRFAPALLASLPFAVAAPAHGATLTLGSDLQSAATVVESHPADTAFWQTKLGSGSIDIPEDGQVVAIKVKGSALKERGAADPATLVHFQSLDPAAADGSRTVWLTSAGFDMPFDNPSAVTTFQPENLCVHKGGAVTFNTIGGFKWGGSLTAPLDNAHYHNGTPWQIFAPVRESATAWYSKDNGTKNGATLVPFGGTNAADGLGATQQGEELLMQVVVATGNDRSQSCGGPARHPDGTLVAPKVHELRVAGGIVGGVSSQRPYVTKNRKFNVGVYCESPDDGCTGTATMLIGKRAMKAVSVNVPANSSGKVALRLSKKDFKKLDKKKSLKVTFVLVSQFGTVTTPLNLKR